MILGLLTRSTIDIEDRTDWRGFYVCEGFSSVISRGVLSSSWGIESKIECGKY